MPELLQECPFLLEEVGGQILELECMGLLPWSRRPSFCVSSPDSTVSTVAGWDWTLCLQSLLSEGRGLVFRLLFCCSESPGLEPMFTQPSEL